jgi:predicted ferric reductase
MGTTVRLVAEQPLEPVRAGMERLAARLTRFDPAYLAAALGLSFYARKRIGAKLWRKLHMATIAVYVLAVVHTLGAGTDVAWLGPAMLISGAPILFLLTLRMLPQRARGDRRTRTGTSAVPGAS